MEIIIHQGYFKDSASIFFFNTLQIERIKEISDDYNGYKQVMAA